MDKEQANAAPFDDRPDEGFIRADQLLGKVIPFSSATLWRKVREGTFPKPCKLGPRMTAWRVADIRAWLMQPGGGAGA